MPVLQRTVAARNHGPRLVSIAALAVACSAQAARAQIRPDANWRQITTSHFNVIYEPGVDSIARRAATRAELEHARLATRLIRAPAGRIDIVLSNDSDITNGFATQFPDKRIVIWIRPPIDELSLQGTDEWIDLVIAHELTHIFHLDQAGRVGRGLRAAFGRVPFTWPLFPLVGTPRWSVEGLATLIESQHTGRGRLHGSYHEMVVRTAVLENAFPTIDRVSGETPLWPGGTRAYVYGSLFMDYLTQRFGDSAHTELIKKSAGSVLPPVWRMDAIAKNALGVSFRDLFRDWHEGLEHDYDELALALRRVGLTQPEALTTAGRWALHPRIAHDGRRLAYADENGRAVAATRIIDPAGGEDVRIRRNGLGPISWLPGDSAYVTAQLEFASPYEIYSDLYLVRGERATRLTTAARAETPDVNPAGTHIIFVQNVNGTNRLMQMAIATGDTSVLVEQSPAVHWTLPRWSPDGRRIAVQRWHRQNGHDVVILDTQGREVGIVRTEGVDGAPAWSPDGRHLVFSSDRTGITNLYAYDVDGAELHQVTNVLGGAYYPEISRDQRWIYYSGYHADGFHIERIPYDPATWRAPLPAAPQPVTGADRVPIPGTFDPATITISTPKPYSPVASLLPRFWLPLVWGDTALGEFIGAITTGTDDVGRHSYYAQLGYDGEHGRVAGNFTYAYAGLGNPLLRLEAAREWDYTGRVAINDSTGQLIDAFGSFEREDRVTLTAELRSRRWRASNSVAVGIEGVVFNRRVLGPVRFRDPKDKLLGVIGSFGFANYTRPALAISPENGVSVGVLARRRFELEPGTRDASYTELLASAAAYKSTGGGRFAHEVVALRASALHRTDIGRGPTDIGGVVDFLPVRGFSKRGRVGFRAWTASLEYRMPLALVARGYRLRPLFIDRVAAAFFVDAGNASCDAAQRQLYLACPGVNENPTEPLVSAGFEINANVALLVFLPSWLRTGVAFPLRGGDRNAKLYVTFGPSF